MARYVITYDLSAPGRDYEDLYNRIKSYPNWAHITESTWAIVSRRSQQQIRDHLGGALDDNDKLLVGRLGRSAWTGLGTSVSEWLKANRGE